MADQKVSDLPSLNGADVDAADLLYIIDSSAGSAGSKKITVGQYQLAPVSGGTANGVMYLNGSKVVTTGSGLVFDGTNFSTTGTATATKLIPTGGSATGNGMYLPAANTLAWSTNGAQAMTLDASGNLSIQDGKQYFWGTGRTAIQGTSASDMMQFFTASLERARITSGGDLLVGKTDLTNPTTTDGFIWYKNASGGGGTLYATNGASGTALALGTQADASLAVFFRSGTQVGSISVTTTATAYNTSSDRRLKENIAPAADAGAVIDAIEIVQHDWKVGGHTRFGVIAQDLNAVAPEAVSAGDDGDEIEKTWGVDYSKLVPMLIKEIQSLRARVAALESQ